MAVLGGFNDDVWFGLQNAQQTLDNGFFANQNMIINNNNNNNNMGFVNNYVNHNANQEAAINLESQLELQRRELEFVLHLQNEKLRILLHEQRRQQISSLMKSLEAKATRLLKQKDDELARATRKWLELQAVLSRAESESQAWQRIARAKETTITELNNALEQARNDNNDAVSSCFSSSDDNDTENDVVRKWVCKKCKARSSCVVFVPCKHLCSCLPCEAFLGSCPVCGSAKEASFEVFLV